MRLLQRRIRLRDQWSWLAQPKTKLAEQALTLAHTQPEAVPLVNPRRQGFAVPEIDLHAGITGNRTKHSIDLIDLRCTQSPRPARPLSFSQTRQTILLKFPNPVFHGTGSITQQPPDIRASHTLGDQQDTVQAVIISGFLRTLDLLL